MSEPTGPASPSTGRPRSGLKPMAALMWRVAAPSLRKRGLAEARIVTDWREIVGPLLAATTSPDRLKREAEDRPGALHIRVAGPAAIEIQHLAPQIIERVNAYFGYPAIDRLRLVQAPPSQRKPRRRSPAPPDPATRQAVETRVAEVADDDLRAALTRLGLAIEARAVRKR